MKFKRAKDWVGLRLDINEMKKYVCSWIGPQSDNDIMFGQINAKARKSSIKILLNYTVKYILTI